MSINPRASYPTSAPAPASRRPLGGPLRLDPNLALAQSIAEAWRRESAESKARWRAADEQAERQRSRAMGNGANRARM
jgi:hypothetical protein